LAWSFRAGPPSAPTRLPFRRKSPAW